jgi:hypothetical protein
MGATSSGTTITLKYTPASNTNVLVISGEVLGQSGTGSGIVITLTDGTNTYIGGDSMNAGGFKLSATARIINTAPGTVQRTIVLTPSISGSGGAAYICTLLIQEYSGFTGSEP